jgi:hypothetical protein
MTLRRTGMMTVGLVFAAVASASAQQPGFSAADLPVVMSAYVDAAIDMRAAYETCAPADKRPGQWEEGAALLIASLHGAGLNANLASALEARLAASVVPVTIDCAGEQLMLYSGVSSGETWLDYHRTVLELNGIRIVEPGVRDARLEAVRSVVAEALPQQKRMLVCVSLFDPRSFLSTFWEWNGLVARAAQALVAAGFGPGDYGPFLDGALSRALFTPPADRVEAAADCMADRAWLDRFSTFAWYSFAADIETALAETQP